MKKIVIITSVLLALACVYLFIPNRITISEKMGVAANQPALFRNLGELKNWKKWWPGELQNDTAIKGLLVHGLEFKITEKRFLSYPISISNSTTNAAAELTFITISVDSTDILFTAIIPTSYNPIKRIQAYFTAGKIKKEIKKILSSINTYYSKNENLYEYNIQELSVTDSILLSTFIEIKTTPSTEVVYGMIDELRNYAEKNGAAEKGYPMMNVFTKDGTTFLVRVAIPIDKKLPSFGNISYKWMLGGGNILITEVKGGEREIKKAYDQIQFYIEENKRIAPAIPFQSLITDRRQQPDSSKWITKIYYPVM